MSVKLKPLHQQVFLITGASSGIGRVTARRAAELGAKVVLVARNEEALKQAVEQIKADGGEATYAVADVADAEQFKAAAEAAVSAFGPIDTWVNNAGIGQYADITQDNTEDDRKLFETNFWGIVNGSRLASQYLRDGGGALINVGSEVSDVTTPTQGMYVASKHAVLGFTDAFRMEVIKSELPISVTLIKPAGIDTPFPKHAKNNTDKEATLPAPVYSPELVADQILHAAEFGGRELYVGGGGRAMVLLAEHFPTLADWVISKFMPSQEQNLDKPADHSNEALHAVGGGAYEERGGLKEQRMVRERSLYGVVSRHPMAVTFITAAAAAGLAYVLLKPEQRELSRAERFKRALQSRAGGPLDSVKDYARQALNKAHAYAEDYADTARGYAKDARSTARDYADTARDYVDTAKDKVRGYASDARDYAEDTRGTVRDYADDYTARAKKAADRARNAAHDHADTAVDRISAAANDYVGKPAEQLLASIRRGIEKYLG